MFNCTKPSTRYTPECAIYIYWHIRYHPAKLKKTVSTYVALWNFNY